MVTLDNPQPQLDMPTESAGREGRWSRLVANILDQNQFDLVCRLTLLIVILHPFSAPGITWYQSIIIISMGTCAMISLSLLRLPAFWFALAAFRFASMNCSDWAYANNHDWLITYWCLALACSLCLANSEAALAVNARWLLRLTFIIAAFWKISVPAFVDGGVDEYLLYTDPRFSALARVLGDFSFDTTGFDAQLVKRMDALHESIPLREDRLYPKLAKALAWWTILIEAGIAALLMLRRNHKLAIWGDFALWAFILTTYCWLNVFGFAWILIVMELAQCPREYRKLRLGFLGLLLWSFVFAGGDLKGQILDLLQP